MILPVPTSLSPNVVYIWLASFPSSANFHKLPWQWLSPDERARVEQGISGLANQRFAFCRCLLRSLLGLYTGQHPQQVSLIYAAAGKPHLGSLYGSPEELHFNLSHAQDQVILAFRLGAAVGIDIERMDVNRPYLKLLQRICTASEWSTFNTLSADLQCLMFYRLWARKEALIKLRGDRLFPSLSSLTVPLTPEPIAESVSRPPAGDTWLADLDAPSSYTAAIATDGMPQNIVYITCERAKWLQQPIDPIAAIEKTWTQPIISGTNSD